jgi:hypothetical protein
MDILGKGAVMLAVYMALPNPVSFGIGLYGMYSIMSNKVITRNTEIITNTVMKTLL